MIASLAMYDHPGLHAANDRLWAAIRAALGAGPERLTRGRELDGALMDHWLSPDLLLGQTCGLPYRARLAGRVTRIGTPDYGLPGCPPGYYRSLIMVRKGARLGEARRFAFNDGLSHSGWAGPVTWLRARGLRPGRFLETGAHVASAHAVATGAADICGVDARTWEMIADPEGLRDALEIVGRTAPAPGLPLITAKGRDPAPLRRAVRTAIAGLSAADRGLLGLRGLAEVPDAEYLAQPSPPPP